MIIPDGIGESKAALKRCILSLPGSAPDFPTDIVTQGLVTTAVVDALTIEDKAAIAEAAWRKCGGRWESFRGLCAWHLRGDTDLFA